MKEKLIKIAEELARYGEDAEELRFWIEFFDSLGPDQQKSIYALYEEELARLVKLEKES